jgi:hypothetical protein
VTARYEILPGWGREIEEFALSRELAFAKRWNQVCQREGSGAWKVDEKGNSYGTRRVGQQLASTCAACLKPFTDPDRNATICFACAISLRPAEPFKPKGTECPISVSGFHEWPSRGGQCCHACGARR